MKKVLLFGLMVFSFMFMTTNVNAQELKELDSSVLDVIGDTLQINKKESEVYGNFESHQKLEESTKQEYIQKIKEAGYDTSKIDNGIYMGVFFGYGQNDGEFPRKVMVRLDGIGTKEVNIEYSNTSEYNEDDANYVKNQLKNLKIKKYTYEDGSQDDAVYMVFDLNDKVGAQGFYRNYDFSSLLDDKTITIKVAEGGSGFSGNPWGESVVLDFFKNDIAYASKVIMFVGYFGTTLDNGTPIVMDQRDENTEIYKEMSKELEKLGLTNVLGCYELTSLGSISNNMIISFSIDSRYNGRGVKILHRKSDGTFEAFDTKVVNGKATITVNEFSPFIIALTDDDNVEVNKAPNNAQTSSMDVVLYSLLAVGSLVGIVYIVVSKKRRKIA